MTSPADLAAVCRRMRQERVVALGVHENPDPDALGAAAGMRDVFRQLGVAAEVYVRPGETLPAGRLVGADDVRRTQPPGEASVYALDCGSEERLALPEPPVGGIAVNIDHHHDNPRYGDLTYVRGEASSTCELVCNIAQELGVTPSLPAAVALYVGISFDTGHFHHASTGARTFACAAWLREIGVDVTAVYSELYERRSAGSLRLWARAVAGATPVAGGRGLVAAVGAADYAACGAGADETEGIVESLRSVNGVEVAALVKEDGDDGRVRVSLRSRTLDVSAIAAARGGGGHRLAAGFSSDEGMKGVTGWLSSELERRLSTASC